VGGDTGRGGVYEIPIQRPPAKQRWGAPAPAGDDDIAFYYSFLQDAAPLVLDDLGGNADANAGAGSRNSAGASEDDGAATAKKDINSKKRSIARILTSLEAECGPRECHDASRRKLAVLESNAYTRS
jgi:hypothetical protein